MEATPERLSAWIDKLNAIADDMENYDNAAEFPAHIDSITEFLVMKRAEIIARGPIVQFKNIRNDWPSDEEIQRVAYLAKIEADRMKEEAERQRLEREIHNYGGGHDTL